MAMDAADPDARESHGPDHLPLRFTRFECETELGVDAAGTDVLVGMRGHTRLDAELDVGSDAHAGGDGRQPVQFGGIVHRDPADPGGKRFPEFRRSFVVPMENDVPRIQSGTQRGIQLAPRHHVRAQSFGSRNAQDRCRAERLGRVQDAGGRSEMSGSGMRESAAGITDPLFIQHMQRRAEPRGQFERVAAADHEMTGRTGCQFRHALYLFSTEMTMGSPLMFHSRPCASVSPLPSIQSASTSS